MANAMPISMARAIFEGTGSTPGLLRLVDVTGALWELLGLGNCERTIVHPIIAFGSNL
jgi:hypothetical protein